VTVTDLGRFVDHARQTVTSSTGELRLDYGRGILLINASRVQGASGALRQAGPVDLGDLAIASELDLGHIVAVALDDRPLASSHRILLQVMSEEQESGRRTESVSPAVKRIVELGTDPWQVKVIGGQFGSSALMRLNSRLPPSMPAASLPRRPAPPRRSNSAPRPSTTSSRGGDRLERFSTLAAKPSPPPPADEASYRACTLHMCTQWEE